MDFFEQLKKNVTQAGQTAVDKAKKAADLLKLREQIRQDKREIRDITYRIGKRISVCIKMTMKKNMKSILLLWKK